METILIIEDDAALASGLCRALKVKTAHCKAAGRSGKPAGSLGRHSRIL